MTDDEEVAALRAEHIGRWWVTRLESGALCFAREPGRGYHIVAADAGEAAESIAFWEKHGSLVRGA